MTQSIDVARDASHLPTGDPSRMVFVRTLGAVSIDAGATHLTPSSVRKFALLFYLWAERGRSSTRATLHDLIFPDQTATNARHSIRELIYQFRKLGARIASDGETVELATDSVRADYTDVMRQERPSLEQLRAAEGGFLPGYAPAHSEAFSEWLERLRARAIGELNRVFVGELNRARKLGDWTVAEASARAVLALDPLHEEATLATAEMLAIGGAKAQAVRLLDRYVEEVGTASPDLRVPAAVLRRRISERSREIYRAPLTLPFLGRDAEMSALQERFTRARAGEAQCVVLVGEAGIGKTRLAEELCTQAVLTGASVERVATQPHDTHRPMATFADLVPRLLQLPGALGCSPDSMSALRRLTKHDSNTGAVETETNSEVIAAAIARALTDLIDSIASESPLVILVDDAQWTDERSRQTFAALASGRQPRQLMLVLTSRDRTVVQFLAQQSERVVGLTLAPLTSQSSKELTSRALIEQVASDGELRDWIASTSGGNPFFLKCLIGHFQTTGERFVVPTTLSVLLDQKVAALGVNASALLGTCVALGRHSELERVLTALEMPQIDLQIAAAELESANLIVQAGRRIEPAHTLVAEAVARLTSPVVWRLVHRRIASVLQAEAETSQSTVLLWDCAEHWSLAGERERAAKFLERCADRAIEIGRPREAGELLLRAAATTDRNHAVSLVRRAAAIADEAREVDVVKLAVASLRQLGVRVEADPIELAELHATMAAWDDPEYVSERLCAWVASDAPLHHRIHAATTLLIMAEVDGRPGLAEKVFDGLIRTLPSAETWSDGPTLTLFLIYHCAFGDLDQVHAIARQLMSLTATASDAVAADILRKCGVAFWRLGRTAEALDSLRQCYLRCKRIGLIQLQYDAARMLMGICKDVGSPEMEEWRHIGDFMVSEEGQLARSASNILLQLDDACSDGDLAGSRKWLEAGQRLSESSRLYRIQRWIRAAAFRVRQLEGDVPGIQEVRRLVDAHRPNAEISDIGDFEMAVVLQVLSERAELDLATQLLEQYLTVNRRGRSPQTLMLREAIARMQSALASTAAGGRSAQTEAGRAKPGA